MPGQAGLPLSIGDVAIPSRFFLAPLAGYTSLAFRLAVRGCGGLGLATTDLVNARALIEGRKKSFELSETAPGDDPLAVQIFGANPEEMPRAAQIVVARGADLVDINMGCPVRKVTRNGGGSALMKESDAAARLVESVVRAVPVPVTVKMRLGWDKENLTAPELARRFEEVGAQAVIVHGRTRSQGFRGDVDRDGIRQVVEAVERIPVVGNGDVRSIHDAEVMMRETGCAAISIGRGALANPFFFAQLGHWVKTGRPGPDPTFDQRLGLMSTHYHKLVERRGEHFACLQFRKTLRWYSKWTRMPKPQYHRLITMTSVATFDEALAEIREAGPISPLPGHLDAQVPVPKGPIDKW